MTQTTDLLALLQETDLPVAYREWKEPPRDASGNLVPYLIYLFTNSADLMADNVNFHELSDWQVELYSVEKDPASEEVVEATLKGAGVPYEKREQYLDTEKMNQVVYLVRTI